MLSGTQPAITSVSKRLSTILILVTANRNHSRTLSPVFFDCRPDTIEFLAINRVRLSEINEYPRQ